MSEQWRALRPLFSSSACSLLMTGHHNINLALHTSEHAFYMIEDPFHSVQKNERRNEQCLHNRLGVLDTVNHEFMHSHLLFDVEASATRTRRMRLVICVGLILRKRACNVKIGKCKCNGNSNEPLELFASAFCHPVNTCHHVSKTAAIELWPIASCV